MVNTWGSYGRGKKCGKKVLWNALGIDSVIDFLVLILAVFFMVFGIDFFGIEKGPSEINIHN